MKRDYSYWRYSASAIAAIVLLAMQPVQAKEPGSDSMEMNHHMDMHDGNKMDHSAHMKYMQHPDSFKTSIEKYTLPDTPLISKDGEPTSLNKVLDTKDGVMLNFIFTSCTSICPTMSAIFSAMDKRISATGKPIRLVSISIDPEFDTPSNLRKYARKFHASDRWTFLTGKREDIVNLQKQVNAYRGNKMNHFPATFIRHAGRQDWLRVEGFIVAPELEKQYDKLSVQSATR